jgi:DNA-binding NarL/FixJ family response regulator
MNPPSTPTATPLDWDARLLVVADVRIYREALATNLERGGFQIIGAVAGLDEARLFVRAAVLDLVVIDFAMRDSLNLVRALRAEAPELRIILFAVNDDDAETIVASARVGVTGYVGCDGSFDDLAAAVRSAIRGELKCSPRMAATIFRELGTLARSQQGAPPAASLTRREQEILALIARGLSNKEIAQQLHIELPTVKNHVHSILGKLEVSSRSAALARLRNDARDPDWLPAPLTGTARAAPRNSRLVESTPTPGQERAPDRRWG